MENFTFQICKLDLCHVDTTALVCPWLPSVTTKDKPQQQHLTIPINFFFLSLQILYHHLFQKKYPFICLKLLLTPPKLARREKSFPQKKGGSWFSQPQNANINLGYPNKIQSIAYIVTGKGVGLWRFQKRPKVSIQPVTCRPVSLRPFCFCLLLCIETASHTGIPLPFFTSVRYSMFSFTFTIQINLNSSSSNHSRSIAAGGGAENFTLSYTIGTLYFGFFSSLFFRVLLFESVEYTLEWPMWLVRVFVVFWSLVRLLFTPAYVGFDGSGSIIISGWLSKSPIASPTLRSPRNPKKERKEGKKEEEEKMRLVRYLVKYTWYLFYLPY